jgi:hypothetical protein
VSQNITSGDQVLIEVNINIKSFWDARPCSPVVGTSTYRVAKLGTFYSEAMAAINKINCGIS